jgi:hypothetical protein
MEENTVQSIQENPITEAPAVPTVAPVEKKTGWIPKKTFLLIALLIVVTVCLLVLALIPSFKSPTVTKKPVANIDYAQTLLSFSKPIAATPSGYATDVLISTGKNKVTVAQLEIVYDPKILTNVNIKPGSFFTAPTILLQKIDAANGRISYVLGIGLGDKPVTGKGTVATISYSVLPGLSTVKTPINFEPKTQVNAAGYVQSVLKQSTGVLFSISPTPTTTK